MAVPTSFQPLIASAAEGFKRTAVELEKARTALKEAREAPISVADSLRILDGLRADAERDFSPVIEHRLRALASVDVAETQTFEFDLLQNQSLGAAAHLQGMYLLLWPQFLEFAKARLERLIPPKTSLTAAEKRRRVAELEARCAGWQAEMDDHLQLWRRLSGVTTGQPE